MIEKYKTIYAYVDACRNVFIGDEFYLYIEMNFNYRTFNYKTS